MRIVSKILTVLWTIFWGYAGVSILIKTPYQIKKDEELIKNELNPCIKFVETFKSKNNRLPSYREFYTWGSDFFKDYTSDLKIEVDSLLLGVGRVKYIRSNYGIILDDLSKFKEANWKKDYAIGVWRGELMEYYFSWNKEYDTNNYSWIDAFKTFMALIGVGLLPLVFWKIYLTKRKKT